MKKSNQNLQPKTFYLMAKYFDETNFMILIAVESNTSTKIIKYLDFKCQRFQTTI